MRGLYLVFVIIIGYIYAQNNTQHPHTIHDQLRTHASKRLINMSYELVIEAKLLQRQMQPIQSFYQGQITYEMGYVMGKIRERYKRMIEIYKQAHYMTKHLYLNEMNETAPLNTTALKPGIKMYYPINWVINMEYMRLFEIDIDKLVEVLENIPSYALLDIDKDSNTSESSNGLPKVPGPDSEFTPPDGIVSNTLPPYPTPSDKDPNSKGKPRGPAARTGQGPGYLPGDLGFLRSGPSSVLNEAPPSVPNEPPPSVPNEPTPSVPNEAPPSVPNEAPPSVPNEAPPSDPNDPSPRPPSQSNEPPLGQNNEPPPDPERQPYVAPQSQSYDSPPNFPNEAPPDPGRQSYEAPQSQSYDSPPSFPNEAPPHPERQSYEASQSQSYDSPPSFPNEAPPAPERQSYDSPLNQPYPGQDSEPLWGPPSWRTKPPAASNGKVIRFGSADNNFRTEEELKQYYRAMYRAKHNGINDKYDDLYR